LKKGILLHESDDDVGVATMDLTADEVIQAVTLEGDPVAEIQLVDDVPLAHKVAMRAMATGHDLIEYGRPIGSTSVDIPLGAHVHTHNLQSRRWGGRSQIVDHHGEQS
jgi:(2R)-sulfolactate sulfo-lyase subunit alpha